MRTLIRALLQTDYTNEVTVNSELQAFLRDQQAVIKKHMERCVGSSRYVLIPRIEQPQQSWNGELVASMNSFDHLRRAVVDQHAGPNQATSNVGLLCGPRALALGLNAMRQVVHQERGYGPVNNINPDQIMTFLFADYNPTTANDPTRAREPNMQGTPTPAYARFLTRRLRDFGLLPGSEAFIAEWELNTQLNNINVDTLGFMTDFLYEEQVYSTLLNNPDIHFNLGVITRGHQVGNQQFPARAYVFTNGNTNGEDATVWLNNDGFEETIQQGDEEISIFGHWEPFTLGDIFEPHGYAQSISWGLPALDAADLDLPTSRHFAVSVREI